MPALGGAVIETVVACAAVRRLPDGHCVPSLGHPAGRVNVTGVAPRPPPAGTVDAPGE